MATDPLQLRSLPQAAPPRDLWPAIAAELDRAADSRWRQKFWPRLAIAASLVAVALGLALLRPAPQGDAQDPALDRLARLQSVSGALESRLQGHRDTVLDARTVDTIARLERELAWLDLQISESPDDPGLWAERVVLLSEITERYMRSDWRAELMLASY